MPSVQSQDIAVVVFETLRKWLENSQGYFFPFFNVGYLNVSERKSGITRIKKDKERIVMRLSIICLIILLFGYYETEEVREELKRLKNNKKKKKSWL